MKREKGYFGNINSVYFERKYILALKKARFCTKYILIKWMLVPVTSVTIVVPVPVTPVVPGTPGIFGISGTF